MKTKLMPLSFILVTVGAFPFIVQGCASSAVEKSVEAKISQENSINSRSDLQAEAGHLIENDKDLTAEQKTQLTLLRTSVKAKTDEMWTMSLKLKSILFKDLMQTKYDENEVELIKERLRTLESKRLNVLFDAITETNKILGRQADTHQWLARQYFFENAAGQLK